MDGLALKPLTVDFHEPGFVGQLGTENGFGFWFQLSDDDKQKLGSIWGPANPQALNRYSYARNGPVRYTDPSGHLPHILKAWKEWAVNQHEVVDRWVAKMTATIRSLRDKFVEWAASGAKANLQDVKDYVNSLDLPPESKELLIQSADTAIYFGNNLAADSAKIFEQAAMIGVWLYASGARQQIDSLVRRATDYENSHKDSGGVLSPPPGYSCDSTECVKTSSG